MRLFRIPLLRTGAYLFLSLAITAIASGQRASECLLAADFETDELPEGWDIGPSVERLDANGNGTGEFVAAWRVGTTAEANANGWFPVPSSPPGNRFIMANDDAPPCDCAMDEVILTSPVVDLGSATNATLAFRVFHDGAFGSGDPVVEASQNGGSDWTVLQTLGAQPGQWQHRMVSLGAYDGQPEVQVRFRWSDNGNWASGVAFDDICIFSRLEHDLAIGQVLLANVGNSVFDPATRALEYTEVPLSQATPLSVSAQVFNRGVLAVFGASLEVEVLLDGETQGTYISDPLPVFSAGGVDTLVVHTEWVPGTVGEVEVRCTVVSSVEDDPADNTAERSMRITGPGLEAGNDRMALDRDDPDASLPLSEADCTPVNLFEIQGGGTIHGIGLRFAEGTFPGGTIRALLLDDNFNELGSTGEQAVDEAAIWAATNPIGWVIPLEEPHLVEVMGHVFAAVEGLDVDATALLATSGYSATGASYCLGNDVVAPLENTPMIRIHLSDPVLGVADGNVSVAIPVVAPNPFTDRVTLLLHTFVQGAELRIHALDGRLVHITEALTGTHIKLDLGHLAPGTYIGELRVQEQRSAFRLQRSGAIR